MPETISGILVPAAKTVKPATLSGISIVYEIITVIHTSI